MSFVFARNINVARTSAHHQQDSRDSMTLQIIQSHLSVYARDRDDQLYNQQLPDLPTHLVESLNLLVEERESNAGRRAFVCMGKGDWKRSSHRLDWPQVPAWHDQ